MSLTSRFRITACSGALAVALGAFGAHGLRETLSTHQTADIWETAALYHFIHTFALLWNANRGKPQPWWCFLFGIAVFSTKQNPPSPNCAAKKLRFQKEESEVAKT